jgi:hypothetical protein
MYGLAVGCAGCVDLVTRRVGIVAVGAMHDADQYACVPAVTYTAAYQV